MALVRAKLIAATMDGESGEFDRASAGGGALALPARADDGQILMHIGTQVSGRSSRGPGRSLA
jgi:hypothetical protein